MMHHLNLDEVIPQTKHLLCLSTDLLSVAWAIRRTG
jgi:hypothetical protein